MHTTGYEDLVYEILLLTHFDLKQRGRKGGQNFRNRQDALAFMESQWFETLCHSVDLEPHTVKMNLMRAAYEPQKIAR